MTPAQLLTALLVGSGVSLGLAATASEPTVVRNESMSAYGRAVAVAGEFAFVGEPSVGAGGGRGGGGGHGARSQV